MKRQSIILLSIALGLIAVFVLINLNDSGSLTRKDNYYEFPFAGRSEKVVELIKRFPESEVYTIYFVQPNVFVRDAIAIKDADSKLKSTSALGVRFGVVLEQRRYAAKKFVEDNQFKFPCIADTSGEVLSELGIESMPPFITQWSKDGRLLRAASLYTLNYSDSSTVSQFFGEAIPADIEYRRAYDDNSDVLKSVENLPYIESEERVIPIQDDSVSSYGNLRWCQISQGHQYLVGTDKTSLKKILCDYKTGSFISELNIPFDTLHRLSPNLSDKELNEYLGNGEYQPLGFGSTFTSDSSLIVYYSLPTLSVSIQGEDTLLQMRSKHALCYFHLKKSRKGTKAELEQVVPINYDLTYEFVPNVPYELFYDSDNRSVYVEIKKGYPAVGDVDQTPDSRNDPRLAAFYEKTPLFLEVDATNGRIKREVGSLDKLHHDLSIGYGIAGYFAIPTKNGVLTYQPLTDHLSSEDGSKISLKSYVNKKAIMQFVQNETLPDARTLRDILNLSGAAVQDVSLSGDRMFISWKIRKPQESLISQNCFYVVQGYDLSKKELIFERYVNSSTPYGKISDVILDARSENVILITQYSMSTNLILYSTKEWV